jgi:hypothetical protein
MRAENEVVYPQSGAHSDGHRLLPNVQVARAEYLACDDSFSNSLFHTTDEDHAPQQP